MRSGVPLTVRDVKIIKIIKKDSSKTIGGVIIDSRDLVNVDVSRVNFIVV